MNVKGSQFLEILLIISDFLFYFVIFINGYMFLIWWKRSLNNYWESVIVSMSLNVCLIVWAKQDFLLNHFIQAIFKYLIDLLITKTAVSCHNSSGCSLGEPQHPPRQREKNAIPIGKITNGCSNSFVSRNYISICYPLPGRIAAPKTTSAWQLMAVSHLIK